MPGYVNPDKKPPVGGYSWVPSGPPSGDAQASKGFKQPVNLAGEIRNDLPYISDSGTIQVTFSGNLVSEKGSETYPVSNSFRFLQRPSSYRYLPPSVPAIFFGSFSYDFKLRNPTNLSSVEIDYILAINLYDTSLDILVTDEETKKLISQSRESGVVSDLIDFSKILPCKVLVNNVEYPTQELSTLPKELPVTSIYTTTQQNYTNDTYTKRLIRFGSNEFLTSGFPSVTNFTIANRQNSTSLIFKLSKITFFNPKRVNLDKDQVPASAISYAFPLLFKISRLSFDSVYPSAFQNRGTVNVKVFSRDFKSNSPGFAHSINLRFLVASYGLVNIDPFSLLSGSGFNLTSGLSWCWFLGLWPERRNLKFKFSSYYAFSSNERVVPIFSIKLGKIRSFEIEEIQSTSTPNESDNWLKIEGTNRNISFKNIDKNDKIFDTGSYSSEFIGGYTKPFNYVDLDSNDNKWYRIKQYLYSGEIVYSDPVKGLRHTETIPYFLVDNDVSRDSVEVVRQISDVASLSDVPIALFVASDNINFSSLEINKDSFKISCQAKKIDPNELVTTHLYFRFWFVPDDISLKSKEIFNYQNTHEIRFVNSSSGTVIEIGKPRDFTEVLVSAPLSNEYQTVNVVRYINNEFRKNLGFDSQNTNWKLTVGVYTATSNNVSNNGITNKFYDYPEVSLNIGSDNSNIETPFYIVSSESTTGILKASKLPQFTSSTKEDYSKSLSLKSCLSGSRIVDQRIDYNKISTFPSESPVDNCFVELLNLKTEDDISTYNIPKNEIYIPFNSLSTIPAQKTDTQKVVVDFCTDGKLLSRGSIDVGSWNIDLGFNVLNVSFDYSVDVLLVDYNGQIVNRINKSDIRSSTNNNYNFNIQIPFLIPEGNYQIVLRISFYPYTGQTSLSTRDREVGTFIDKIDITSHTIKINKISQNDSAGGSIAFYEDLPLLPSRAIEDNNFWFIAADDLLEGTQPVISDSNGEFTIQGCLYSPSWLLSLPDPTDVEVFTYGLGTNPVLFRTVPGTSVESESSVSAVENKFNKTASVVYNSKTDSSATEIITIDDLNTDAKRQKVIQNGDNTLRGQNPSIVASNYNKNSKGSNHFIFNETDSTDGKVVSIASNTSTNVLDQWSYYDSRILDNKLQSQSNFIKGIKNNSYAVSDNSPEVYILGVAQPGSLVLKVVPLNADDLSFKTAKNILIAGPNVDYPDLFPNLIVTERNQEIIENTYPSICLNNERNPIVSYVVSNQNKKIYTSLINNFSSIRSFITFDLNNYLGSSTSESISGLVSVYDNRLNVVHLVFYLAQSLYYICLENISDSKPYMTNKNKLHFVAGDTSSSNIILSTLKNRKKVYISSNHVTESPIPKQKAGMYLSNKSNSDGSLVIWYKNSSGDLVYKSIVPYTNIYSSKIYKTL